MKIASRFAEAVPFHEWAIAGRCASALVGPRYAGAGIAPDSVRSQALPLLAVGRGYKDSFQDLANVDSWGAGIAPDPVEAFAYLLVAHSGHVTEAEALAAHAASSLRWAGVATLTREWF